MQLESIHEDIAYFSFPNGIQVIADTEDVVRILEQQWGIEKTSRGKLSIRNRRKRGEKSVTLVRLLIDAPDNMLVIHVNGDELDYRKANLRAITYNEQAQTRARIRASVTGAENVALQRVEGKAPRYYVAVARNGVKKSKSFPYTPEGFEEAKVLAERWREDLSYEPPRTQQHRKRRDTTYEHPEREITQPLARQAPLDNPRNTWRRDTQNAYVMVAPNIEAIVSLIDMPHIRQHRWHTVLNSMGGYYAATKVDGKTTYMHRMVTHAPYKSQVDHINHDTLDNRRENLRVLSVEDNNANRNGAYSTSRTGIRGVSVHNTNNHAGKMYKFVCSAQACKVTKYFEYSEAGLEEAKAYAIEHHRALVARLATDGAF